MKNEENFGPVFEQGVSIPHNVTLPDEFIQAFEYMGLAELKITLAAIIQFMRIGGSEPITFSEFMILTGLGSKSSIQAGIDAAMKRGILTRYDVVGYRGHRSYVYEIQTQLPDENLIGTESVPINPVVKLSVDVKENNTNTTTVNLTTVNYEKKKDLKSKLRKMGVFPNTANSLVTNYQLDEIENFLDVYPEAQALSLAEGIGWLVRAIQNRWDIEEIRDEIKARSSAKKRKLEDQIKLPTELIKKINKLGWLGSTKEICSAYFTDLERVNAWADYTLRHQDEYHNPAGIFRNGIRNDDYPPAEQKTEPDESFSWAFRSNPENDDYYKIMKDARYEEWLAKKDSIPENIESLWQLTYQEISENNDNPYFHHWGQKLFPCQYQAEPETLFIAVEKADAEDWLMKNMKYKFEDIFRKHYLSGVQIIFKLNPYQNREE